MNAVAENNRSRIHWLDYAKVIGIFLVVLGHTPVPKTAIDFIYAFHMPLFFFFSGFLFKRSKFPSFRAFALHRFRQLLVPYLYFNLITYLFWLFVGRKFGGDADLDISPLTPLIGVAYGTDAGHYLIHCGSLWFLACLYVVELIYFAADERVGNKWLLLGVIVALAYGNYKLHHVMLPFSFDVALIALVFYMIGHKLQPLLPILIQAGKGYRLAGCLVSLAALLLMVPLNGRADMSSNTYQNFFAFLVIALTGILFSVLLSSLLSDILGNNRSVEYFAKNTLIILAFHSLVGTLIKGVMYFALNVPSDIYKGSLLINSVFSLFTFLCLLPVIYLLNRYFPFMLGKVPGNAFSREK